MLPTLLVLGTLSALGLMLAVLLRTQKRYDAVRTELERMKVVQRDMSTDVRARLEESARTWESVESEVRPRLAQLEPSVADLSAALSTHLPALAEAGERLEAVEERIGGSEARVSAVLERLDLESTERFERLEDAVRTLRNAADARLVDLGARLGALEGPAGRAEAASEAGPPPEPSDVDVGEEELDPRGSTREPALAGARGRGGSRAGHGTGWFVFALMLVAGLVLVISSLV